MDEFDLARDSSFQAVKTDAMVESEFISLNFVENYGILQMENASSIFDEIFEIFEWLCFLIMYASKLLSLSILRKKVLF